MLSYLHRKTKIEVEKMLFVCITFQETKNCSFVLSNTIMFRVASVEVWGVPCDARYGESCHKNDHGFEERHAFEVYASSFEAYLRRMPQIKLLL